MQRLSPHFDTNTQTDTQIAIIYIYIYIYIYISVVTDFAKIRDISDSDIFRPSIIYRPPFRADHFGLNGIENKSVSSSTGSV